MASYDAVIKLVVQGEEALKRIQDRVDKLYKTIDDLEKKKKYAGSQAAAEFVREQANELERVLSTSKQIIQQDERRIVQQSRLNSAVDLYERRLQQTVNSGAAGLKKFEGQIKEIEVAFKFFKDRGNTTAIQALATELGRMVEYSNNVSRNERARAANQSKVFEYVKQINAYEAQGLKVAEARKKLTEFTAVAGTNQLNEAKKYASAVERQLRLLREQAAAQKQIAAETNALQAALAKLENAQRELENSKLDQKALQIQAAFDKQAAGAKDLANLYQYLFEKQIQLENNKLDEQAARVQTELDKQAAAAAESAAQVEKLNQRQTEFTQRTNAATQAAARQTSEFYRQARIAREVAKLNESAPAAQLLLPAAAPGAPAMSGGARRRITGPVERLGGARTEDEAAMALRLAQNLRVAVPEAAALDSIFNKVEQSLKNIATFDFSKASPVNTGLQKPGVLDAILGGGFPLLFGGGPGAIVGGAAGGLIGGKMGGMAGMALSIGLSALGQKFDQIFGDALRSTQELSQALSRLDIQKLRESSVFVTAELDNQVRLLLEAGKYDEARAVALRDTVLQTGALGTTIRDSANATNLLKGAWDNVLKPVQTLLAAIAAPFIAALAGILNIVGLVAKGINVIVSGIGQLIKGASEWLIKLVGGQAALDIIKNLTGAASEETERLRAASEAVTDADLRDLLLKKQLLDLERARLEGSNRIAKQSQIDTTFTQQKLTAEKELRDEIRRINTEGVQLTDQQRALEISIAQAKASQKIDEAAITQQKAQQQLLNEALIAGLQSQAAAQQAQAERYALVQTAAATVLQIELQRIQQQAQFATSLNAEAALIDQIAAKRQEQADLEYQTALRAADSAVQQAAAEYQIVQAKYEQNNADLEQVTAAQQKLETANLARTVETEVAKLKRQQTLETIELERRQAQVNAYAEEYARITERTTRRLEEQSNALNNQASVMAAMSQAVQTINNVQIQALNTELERTKNIEKRASILARIEELEVRNARVVLEATRAQIRADIARAEVALKIADLKYRELLAVVRLAEAQRVANRAHYAALDAQGSAVRIAADNLETAIKIGNWQWRAADAVFNGAVNAARLKREMNAAASAAEEYKNNAEEADAAQAERTRIYQEKEAARKEQIKQLEQKVAQMQTANAEQLAKSIEESTARSIQAAARLAELQKITIERSAERTSTLLTNARTASQALAAYSQSATPISTVQPLSTGVFTRSDASTSTSNVPTINLQTGPIMQQNGQNYVTMQDFERGLQSVTSSLLGSNRTTGGRRYAGIR